MTVAAQMNSAVAGRPSAETGWSEVQDVLATEVAHCPGARRHRRKLRAGIEVYFHQHGFTVHQAGRKYCSHREISFQNPKRHTTGCVPANPKICPRFRNFRTLAGWFPTAADRSISEPFASHTTACPSLSLTPAALPKLSMSDGLPSSAVGVPVGDHRTPVVSMPGISQLIRPTACPASLTARGMAFGSLNGSGTCLGHIPSTVRPWPLDAMVVECPGKVVILAAKMPLSLIAASTSAQSLDPNSTTVSHAWAPARHTLKNLYGEKAVPGASCRYTASASPFSAIALTCTGK